MIGSANLTWQSLVSNQEACIILDSVDPADDRQLTEVETWFEHVLAQASQIDFQVARRIFEARARYRLDLPDYNPELNEDSTVPSRYWVLKTTAGPYGDQYWPTFVSEDVIAVGWEDIDVDPSSATDDELRQAVRDAYPHDNPSRVANKIKKFVNLQEGDVVILCRGYPPNSSADVHVYGIARVAGSFLNDTQSSWWRFKHPAVIQVIDENLPRDIMAEALNRQSLMETIHELEPARFTVFARTLREHLGITVNV